ncbi:MAG: HAD family hydrolase [Treponema sp.]|nr:HAD family hydrolase [Treponema sp.]
MGYFSKNAPLLFVTDLDDTVINGDGTMSAPVRAALKGLSNRGISIAAATGRPFKLIPDCVKDLSGLSYIISANGAVVCDWINRTQIAAYYLEKKDVLLIYEETTALGGAVDLYFTDEYIGEEKGRELMRRFMTFSKETLEAGNRLFTMVPSAKNSLLAKPEPIIKQVCIFENTQCCQKVLEKLQYRKQISAVSLSGYEIEVTAKHATKGNALAFVRERENMEKSQIVTIGDNDNDLSMRDEAGFFIAMGTAGPHIKALADYVTGSLHEDGAAQAIHTLILNSPHW